MPHSKKFWKARNAPSDVSEAWIVYISPDSSISSICTLHLLSAGVETRPVFEQHEEIHRMVGRE